MATFIRTNITTYQISGLGSGDTINIYSVDPNTYDITLLGNIDPADSETLSGSFNSGAFSSAFTLGKNTNITINEGVYLVEIPEKSEQYLLWSFEATQKNILEIIEDLLCCKSKKDYYQDYTMLLAATQVFEKITSIKDLNINPYQAGVTQVDILQLVFSMEARLKLYYANCFQKSICC